MTREEYVERIGAELRTFFPDAAPDAEEKRAEVLAYAGEEVLGGPGVRGVAAGAGFPLAIIVT